jgi:ferredoxin
MVDIFMKNEKFLIDISGEEMEAGIKARGIFNEKSGEWARNNLTIDYDLCVKCGKCAKNCPARNISMKEQIEFDTKCISCQRCIHGCPVNAFLHRGNRIELYKI